MDLPLVVATGGYGRGDLAPCSDIDLLFVSKALAKKWAERVVAACWDRKLKISYSIRSLDECAEDMPQDLNFMTSLLDRRFICGPKAVYRRLDGLVKSNIAAIGPGRFVAEKLAERDRRHARAGDTRFILQPNVKEGKGGIRDIHTLFWITHFLYGVNTPAGLMQQKIMSKDECRSLEKAHDFLSRIRAEMHLIAGRAEDRLTFDIQPDVALRIGYKDEEPNVRAEKFMRDYFLTASETGYLTRVLCADLEARALAGGATAGMKKMALTGTVESFPLLHNRLTVTDARHFVKMPEDAARIFRVSQLTGHDIHPDALRLLRKVQKAQGLKIFFEILQDRKNAAQTLRHMNEAGILAALIPEFANIFAHMQYDMYHVYTADEHTIHTLDNLHKIENGVLEDEAPLASALFKKIHLRRALYAAMFFHDIAKGTGGQHAKKGAVVMRKYGPLLGLSTGETEMAAWLVANHLLMTMTAFKHDLGDPQTINIFSAAVQLPERLKLLTVMTTADIMGVGPERWNNWKAGLLSELYTKTNAILTGIAVTKEQRAQEFSAETIRLTPCPEKDYTEVVIYTSDRQGLFSLLSGAMAASGASIVDARIQTLENGMALDTFYIQDLKGKHYDNLPYLKKMVRAALDGKIDVAAEIAQKRKSLPRRQKLFRIPTQVIVDNGHSTATMIEVSAKDRPGLLHDITAAITGAGLQISSAKVTTFGAKAMDVFYVRDAFGLKITHPDKITHIENIIRKAVEHE